MKNETQSNETQSSEKPSQTDQQDKSLSLEELEQVSGGLMSTKVCGGGQCEEG